MDEWELRYTEELMGWMLPRQRRMLRILIRAQELNARQLRRSARQRLRRNDDKRDKTEVAARTDLRTQLLPLVRHLSKATGAEFSQLDRARAQEAEREARVRARRLAQRNARA